MAGDDRTGASGTRISLTYLAECLGGLSKREQQEVFERAAALNAAAAKVCEVERIGGINEAARFGLAERISLANVDEAFRYQPWNPDQQSAGEEVREALTAAAKVFLRRVPDGPLRTRAINMLFDARMVANAAITFRGRF